VPVRSENMRFVVLIKQVPAELSANMNADFTMNRQRVQKITNPADSSALAMALDWKNRLGGEVVCITMGPASAADCLREAAMAGADVLYHVCDPAIAGADTFVTAQILAAVIRRIGDTDIVFCGRHSIDGETGQVGAELATMLGYGCLSQVLSVESMEQDELCCTCLDDGGTEQYRLRRPAVLCVCENRSAKTLPSLTAMRRANHMPITSVSLADLGLTDISGKASSPTKVIGVHYKEKSRRHIVYLTDNANEQVAEVIRRNNTKQD
jgi:electron transfer flavoprotein beta subunit